MRPLQWFSCLSAVQNYAPFVPETKKRKKAVSKHFHTASLFSTFITAKNSKEKAFSDTCRHNHSPSTQNARSYVVSPLTWSPKRQWHCSPHRNLHMWLGPNHSQKLVRWHAQKLSLHTKQRRSPLTTPAALLGKQQLWHTPTTTPLHPRANFGMLTLQKTNTPRSLILWSGKFMLNTWKDAACTKRNQG